MIEFSCHTWTFSDLTLPEALGTIARLGFRYADVGLAVSKAPPDARRAAQEIRNDLLFYNLKLADVYLMLPRISLPDEGRDHDLKLFKALLPLALTLETPGITLSPGVRQDDDSAFERTADALRTMVAQAKEVGLHISIEPHIESMAQTPDAALRLLEAVPGLELTLDWAQLIYNNSTHEAIRSLLPRTRHVHMRQASRGHLQAPFDKGKIDLAGVMTDLKAANYDGVICIEIVNTPGRYGITKVSAVGESVRLRDALREARG